MTSTLISRDEVARVGALVRAADRIDAAHSDRGTVIGLNEFAPVALVRFACGCVAYVPLRRLVLDQGPPLPACEVAGCGRPRWEGPYGRGADGGGRSEAVPPAPARRTWTAGEIVDALKAWAEENGRSPSFADWRYRDPAGRRPTASVVRDHHGSWLAALTAAGLTPRSSAPRSRWSRESILEAIRAHHARTGRPPSRRGWAEKSDEHPWPATVVAVCGSWSGAIRDAGFEPARPGRPRRRPST